MTRAQARHVLGNQPTWALRNMARALSLYAWHNGPCEWQKLRALRALGYKVTALP